MYMEKKMAAEQAQQKRMKELIGILNKASKAYYQGTGERMTNFEYDRLYDELSELEKNTSVTLSGSPTKRVGYEVLSELPKERHERPMLSLDKTKSIEDLKSFLGEQKALLSWKLDGLTVVLTYEDGELKKAVTRGNGEIGEVITPNAKVFTNVPLKIPYTGRLILRGEAVIGYRDFEAINEEIGEAEATYKNPRNLCSGSVRQKNSEITARRHVQFYAFALVEADGVDFENARSGQFAFLAGQGFDVVEHFLVDASTIEKQIAYFADKNKHYDIPSDGLVLTYEDLSYSASLGRTAKFPRDSFAFKWKDETAETILREIEWSPSRTGLINPVAIFDPVELEGTTVSRASLHNVSIVEELKIGIGDRILVYKANMIIPQIAENLTKSGKAPVPDRCPACGKEVKVEQLGEAKALYCHNPECPVKQIKSFALFVSRDALDLTGMSEATLEKFTAHGIIQEYRDFFHMNEHKEEICAMEGFGEKSYANLTESAEKARKTTPAKLLYALGIANVGLTTARAMVMAFDGSFDAVRKADRKQLSTVEGVGGVIADAVVSYFADERHAAELDRLLPELILEKEETATDKLAGKTFVITGSLATFENRNAAKAAIEMRGGKVTGSVSKMTDYLVNNDISSGSAKNKKAKELGIPVITEEELLAILGEEGSTNG